MNPLILAVDDEPRALLLLRNLIESENCTPLLAANGQEAIQIAQARHPDVVLLDVMMPDMDGYEVCKRMRSDPLLASVPIVMLTALDDRTSRLHGLGSGADDFLTKPFDSVELRTRLRTIVRLNRFRMLYEQRAQFEAAIEHSLDGVVLAQMDGKIIHHNPAFAAFLTGPVQENFFSYLPDALVEQIRFNLGKNVSAVATPSTLNLATAAVQSIELSHVMVPQGGDSIVLYTVRDITERKALEEQLLHAQRIELLGQLASSTIHDVNNILGVISGYVQLVQSKGVPVEVQGHLHQVLSVVGRGEGMLRQLLAFARGSDKVLEPVDLTAACKEIASMIRETFSRSCMVDFQTVPDLPPFRMDATQLHQIIMNLCVNARDAMPEGGRLTIRVEPYALTQPVVAVLGDTPALGDYIHLSVRDTGTGIPPEVLPKLFDPFFTTKPKGKGTGLGLATVIRLVRQYKGYVTLDTALGKGTCFHCYFPIRN